MKSRRDGRPDAHAKASPGAADDALRALPSVTEMLEHPALAAALAAPGRRGVVTECIRAEIEAVRAGLRRKSGARPDASAGAVAAAVLARIERDARPMPRALNATGVILHSGLGRAPLAPRASAAVAAAAAGYSLLEVDREEGQRRARDTRSVALMRELTGAEAGLFVNNNAAATVLILNTVARGRQVVCSRGEMVEIGGSFRIPDVMEASGCELVSVGTTNKTHLGDYESAIGPKTGALLVVHTSNYKIVGFTERPGLAEICALGKARGVPVVHDLGSGSILKPEELGVGDEPPVSASVRAGADLVCLSGDKLLGGPQAGIILGRKELVERCRNNPLARAFRIDKLRIAAMEATLELFLDPRALGREHSVTRMLAASPDSLRPRAEALRRAIVEQAPAGLVAEVAPCESEAGSGALPALAIPSLAVALTHPAAPPDALARALRLEPTPLFSVVRAGRVLLDVRTLDDGDVAPAAAVVAAALRRLSSPGPMAST
jgi:L-seryl-tRNA(Ser) seleniumtransferase